MSDSQTKASTLSWLTEKLTLFSIPELTHISVKNWENSNKTIISEIKDRFAGRTIVVRSSALDEDGSASSMAGAYDSVLNVPSNDADSIKAAINIVIKSYIKNNRNTADDQIILQEMVLETLMSGVVFTHDLNTGAPYYVINYDDVSGLTNTVTAGEGEYSNRTLYIHRGATKSLRSVRFKKLISAVLELEKVFGSQFLDIEFALTKDFCPHLLQVRKITTQPNWNRATSKRIDTALEGIKRFVQSRFVPCLGTYGSTTVLGQMPDWNPAEMIGRAPRTLAFSLYKKFITDHVWSDAREIMGYSVPRGQPLMVSLAGQPFIDARLSFHSFLPKGLEPKICFEIVDQWLLRLRNNPHLHDKVEFDVAITAYSFDIEKKLDTFMTSKLNSQDRNDFKEALRSQAVKLISDCPIGGISAANNKIRMLEKKQADLMLKQSDHSIVNIHEMIEDCIKLGTVPFSILARHAFIAKIIMNSLVVLGVISEDDLSRILGNVPTITSDFVEDISRLQSNTLGYDSLMTKYGHLRPGTYDILSMRYDQMEQLIIPENQISNLKKTSSKYFVTPEQEKTINKLLQVHNFGHLKSTELLNYFREATIGREYAKFIFSKTISDILELIAKYGEAHGLSRDELSYVSIENILDIASGSVETTIEETLRQFSQEGAQRHLLCSGIRLPQVLFDEAGVHVIPFQVSEPNYITNKRVSGKCIRLVVAQSSSFEKQKLPSLKGKIVLIESADPGFDWIFAQGILGLVTKYGGANSHMAIRCAEFDIPAAIGCGEQRFDTLAKCNTIFIDCSARIIRDTLSNK